MVLIDQIQDATSRLTALFIALVFGVVVGCTSEKPETTVPLEVAPAPVVKSEIRAVWVSVLGEGLRSEEEIRQLVEAVRKANLNTIVAQMHREGAAMFHSTLQPRHASIKKLPDFDPLATLLEVARDTSGGGAPLAVHAWFNSFKIGEQKEYLNSSPAPIAISHPDWYTRNLAGEVQYELDPGVPAVQDHMIAVIEECLKNYDVDGINLDFIRYFGYDRGYNPWALKRFYAETGIVGRPANESQAWSDFRRDQVSSFVKRCAALVWTHRPNAIFSVDAVGWGRAPVNDFSETSPYKEALQDWSGWSEKAWVDLVLRMGYKREWENDQAQEYRDWADYSTELIGKIDGRMVTIGIGGYFNPMQDMLSQYREAVKRGLGTSLFSYDLPVQEASDFGIAVRGPRSPVWELLKLEIYPEPLPPPAPNWRSNRTFIAGYLKNTSGIPLSGVEVAIVDSGFRSKTDGSGFYAFYSLPIGTYKLEAPGYSVDGKTVDTLGGTVTWVE